MIKFLARRGFVYRQGQNWTREHRRWLVSLLRDGGLEPEDRSVFGEYLALLDYKLSRQEDLDGQIEKLAFPSVSAPRQLETFRARGIWCEPSRRMIRESG